MFNQKNKPKFVFSTLLVVALSVSCATTALKPTRQTNATYILSLRSKVFPTKVTAANALRNAAEAAGRKVMKLDGIDGTAHIAYKNVAEYNYAPPKTTGPIVTQKGAIKEELGLGYRANLIEVENGFRWEILPEFFADGLPFQYNDLTRSQRPFVQDYMSTEARDEFAGLDAH